MMNSITFLVEGDWFTNDDYLTFRRMQQQYSSVNLYMNELAKRSAQLIFNLEESVFVESTDFENTWSKKSLFESITREQSLNPTKNWYLFYESFRDYYPDSLFETPEVSKLAAYNLYVEHNVSLGDGGDVDDGPGPFFKNLQSFKNKSDRIAASMGWAVANYMVDKELDAVNYNTSDPYGPGELPVSWFPIGIGGSSPQYGGKNVKGTEGYKKWLVTLQSNIKSLTAMGYTVVDMLDAEESADDTKNDSQANLDKDTVNK